MDWPQSVSCAIIIEVVDPVPLIFRVGITERCYMYIPRVLLLSVKINNYEESHACTRIHKLLWHYNNIMITCTQTQYKKYTQLKVQINNETCDKKQGQSFFLNLIRFIADHSDCYSAHGRY